MEPGRIIEDSCKAGKAAGHIGVMPGKSAAAARGTTGTVPITVNELI